jgi:L-fuculose-phosphate aldolase
MEEREIVLEAGKIILERGLSVGTWGNISMRTAKRDRFVITPSGMSYQRISPEDMVVVDLSGEVVEGRWKPSTEVPLHIGIYKAREDVCAIVHTHPLFSSVLAVLREDIPPILEDMVMLLGERVDVAEYALPGTKELAENAVKALGDGNAVLLANHGSLCVGPDMERALTSCEVLEKSAQVYIYSKMVGQPKFLPAEDVRTLREVALGYLKLWGQK